MSGGFVWGTCPRCGKVRRISHGRNGLGYWFVHSWQQGTDERGAAVMKQCPSSMTKASPDVVIQAGKKKAS